MATDIIARGMITEYKSGTNISFTENEDGSVTISASGDVSSEDTVARDTINNHKLDKNNPHNVTAEQVGLNNVDNTADLDKPISTAVQTALDDKANAKHTHKKSDITDFPNSLPASGGNADTVDNVHISCTNDANTASWLAAFTSTNNLRAIDPARAYVGNAGNADTVDNKHYTDFAQNAVLSTIEQVNDPNLESGIYSAENVFMSFSSDVESYWFMLIVNKHRTSAGYGTQIAIPYDNGDQHGTFYRICRAGNWGNWIRIADGGNADTLDGLHADDFYSSGNKPYVTGEVGSTNGTFITNHGFLPSKVLICPKSPTYGGDIIYSVTTFDEKGFKLAAGAGVPIYDKYEYIIFR